MYSLKLTQDVRGHEPGKAETLQRKTQRVI